MLKLDKNIQAALDATGLPWTVETGGKHYKIRLAGRLVGVFSKGKNAQPSHSIQNTISNIRRLYKELSGDRTGEAPRRGV